MNSLINDERITQYQLKKVIDQWRILGTYSKTVTYTFSPPWIRQQHYDVFYKLHPEVDRSMYKSTK